MIDHEIKEEMQNWSHSRWKDFAPFSRATPQQKNQSDTNSESTDIALIFVLNHKS